MYGQRNLISNKAECEVIITDSNEKFEITFDGNAVLTIKDHQQWLKLQAFAPAYEPNVCCGFRIKIQVEPIIGTRYERKEK